MDEPPVGVFEVGELMVGGGLGPEVVEIEVPPGSAAPGVASLAGEPEVDGVGEARDGHGEAADPQRPARGM